MTTTTATEPTPPVPMIRLATYGVLAVIVASLLNALVRIVAVTLLAIPAEFGPLAWGPVINTTVVGIVGATCVYGFLLRVSKQPYRTFVGASIVVLALSFVPLVLPPVFLAGAPGSVLGTLAVMHVTTAVVAVGLVPRTGYAGGRSR